MTQRIMNSMNLYKNHRVFGYIRLEHQQKYENYYLNQCLVILTHVNFEGY